MNSDSNSKITSTNVDSTEPSKPERVRVFHILCKHGESRNPISRRTNQPITISREEAHSELNGFREEFKDVEEVSDVPWGLFAAFKQGAKERSDCGSFKKYGDLGWFGRGQMQKAFEEASFSLGNGELSKIVDTASGSHLLLRWEHPDRPPSGTAAPKMPKKPTYQQMKAQFTIPKMPKKPTYQQMK